MRRYRVFSLAALAVVMVIALAAFSPKAQTKTFTVVERAETDSTADIGVEGDSQGDVLTFSNEVFDAENKVQIGYDSGYCIRTMPDTLYDCAWTVFLEDGSLMVQGPSIDAGDSVLAVTGGTGAYAGARGQMQFNERAGENEEFDLVFELIQ